jgi:hypothetical protein
MALETCRECGGRVAASASGCPHCGAKLKPGYWDVMRQRQRRALWVMAGIVTVAFIIGAAGG